MGKIKLYIFGAVLLLIIGLTTTVCFQYGSLKSVKKQLEYSNNNYSALVNEMDSLSKNSIEYQMTIKQIKESNDSIIHKMDSIRKQLKIKDKQLVSLGYIASIAKKTDTLYVRDTIFNRKVNIDTTIGDKWYSTNLVLQYPNKIVLSPQFKSEKYITTNANKKIHNPSKLFFINWFKKRDTYIEVTVTESNPYITKTKEKFINKL